MQRGRVNVSSPLVVQVTVCGWESRSDGYQFHAEVPGAWYKCKCLLSGISKKDILSCDAITIEGLPRELKQAEKKRLITAIKVALELEKGSRIIGCTTDKIV